nr:MFS transporter [Nocardiopsis ansamitocini]
MPRQNNGAHETTPPESDTESPNASSPDWRRSYRDVMRVREFQALWLAHALSMTGNYLLNIVVTVLVFQQTDSAFLTGLTLALTFLPPIIAGPLLSGLADLFPRRRVMVISDVIRACLVMCIGIPGMPVWGIWVLLFCSIMPTIPHGAARVALMTEVVQGERYVAGSAIIGMTQQAGTLVGLVAGGAVMVMVGAGTAVVYNGFAFLLSALILLVGVRAHPPLTAKAKDDRRPGLLVLIQEGTRLVFSDARLRTLSLFAWLAGLYMIPYGLANPLAAEIGGGTAAAGLIMAGPSIGAVLGGLVLTRLISPQTRMRMIGPLAMIASLPLLVWLVQPPLWVMVVALVVSGMAAAYQFVANAAFVLCVPSGGRGLAFGLVAAGLQVAQGIGIAIASLLVGVVGIQAVIVTAGVLGSLCALVLIAPWSRLSRGTIELMHRPEPSVNEA